MEKYRVDFEYDGGGDENYFELFDTYNEAIRFARELYIESVLNRRYPYLQVWLEKIIPEQELLITDEEFDQFQILKEQSQNFKTLYFSYKELSIKLLTAKKMTGNARSEVNRFEGKLTEEGMKELESEVQLKIDAENTIKKAMEKYNDAIVELGFDLIK